MIPFLLFLFGFWCVTGSIGAAMNLAYFQREFAEYGIADRRRNDDLKLIFGISKS
jgi:hypothetical protein